MKPSKFAKIAGAGILALSLTILPSTLPASAQASPNAQIDRTRPTIDTTPFQEGTDDNNNWGWLGLIGLLGLANLFRKHDDEPARPRDNSVVGSRSDRS